MNYAARLLDFHGNSAQPEVRIKRVGDVNPIRIRASRGESHFIPRNRLATPSSKHKSVIKIIESAKFKDNYEFQKPHLGPTYGQEVYSF
jgi:hypothetical protein